MAERTLLTVIDAKDGLVEALVQSMPRSFKYHVWASPYVPNQIGTVVLRYLGTIQPTDPTDNIELEEAVKRLYEQNRSS